MMDSKMRTALQIERLKLNVEYRQPGPVLLPLGAGIRQAAAHIQEAQGYDDPQHTEIVVDEECDYVEDLLGAAFVVCQTYITAVVSRAIDIYKHGKDIGVTIPEFQDTKKSILVAGEAWQDGSFLSKVQIIDAFANYFKHREEWRSMGFLAQITQKFHRMN